MSTEVLCIYITPVTFKYISHSEPRNHCEQGHLIRFCLATVVWGFICYICCGGGGATDKEKHCIELMCGHTCWVAVFKHQRHFWRIFPSWWCPSYVRRAGCGSTWQLHKFGQRSRRGRPIADDSRSLPTVIRLENIWRSALRPSDGPGHFARSRWALQCFTFLGKSPKAGERYWTHCQQSAVNVDTEHPVNRVQLM